MSAKTEFQITRKFGPAFSQKLTNLTVSHSPHFMRSNLDPISTISVRAVEGRPTGVCSEKHRHMIGWGGSLQL